MKLGNMLAKKYLNLAMSYIHGNIWPQAILAGIACILPIALLVIVKHQVIAPLNIIPGWDSSLADGKVVARYASDVTEQVLPLRHYLQSSLKENGELPLWNSASFAGDSFIANPINMVLTPLTPLLFVMSVFSFQTLLILLGFFATATCMYLLLRQLGISWSASMIGALSYSYAPFSLFWSLYGIVLIPMAFVPLSLFLYLRWKKAPNTVNAYAILLTISLASGFYFGHFQVALIAIIIVILAALYDIPQKKLSISQGMMLLGIFVTALLLASAQLVPMLAQATQSHRSIAEPVAPSSASQMLNDIMHLQNRPAPSITPDDLGSEARRTMATNPIMFVGFSAGILILVMGFIARRQTNATWLFYLLVFIIGALWQWNSLPQMIVARLSPTAAGLATDYYIPLALLGICVLGSLALNRGLLRFLDASEKGRWLTPAIPIVMLVILFSIGSLQLSLGTLRHLNGLFYILYYGLALLCMLAIWSSRHYRAQLLGVLLVVVTALYSWAQFISTQPVLPASISQHQNPALNYIQSTDSTQPTILDFTGPQTSLFANVQLLSGYDSLYEKSLKTRIDAINFPEETPKTYRDNSLLIVNDKKTTLYQNLGVRYSINRAISDYTLITPGVWRSNQPADSVYYAQSIMQATVDQQLEYIKNGNVEYRAVPIDGQHTVAAAASLSYTHTANTITIHTNSTLSGLVFVGTTYSPDWRAYDENGKLLTIYKAYYNFMAFDSTPGQHTITFRYQPQSVEQGALLASIGGVIIFTTAAYLGYQHYNKRA